MLSCLSSQFASGSRYLFDFVFRVIDITCHLESFINSILCYYVLWMLVLMRKSISQRRFSFDFLKNFFAFVMNQLILPFTELILKQFQIFRVNSLSILQSQLQLLFVYFLSDFSKIHKILSSIFYFLLKHWIGDSILKLLKFRQKLIISTVCKRIFIALKKILKILQKSDNGGIDLIHKSLNTFYYLFYGCFLQLISVFVIYITSG